METVPHPKTRRLATIQTPHDQKERSGEWKDLDKDILLTIYQSLQLRDLIVGAPLCCTSWYKASKHPSLWRDVDLRYFDHHYYKPSQLVEFVVKRSQDSLTSINFPFTASPDDLFLVAQRCPGLKHFQTYMSDKEIMSGRKTIGFAIRRLKKLEGMDVPESFIEETRLEQINGCCPNFTKLRVHSGLSKNTASLISTMLPRLKAMDLSYSRIDRETLVLILKDFNQLEQLDISRCGTTIEGDVEIHRLASRLKEFKWDDSIDDPWQISCACDCSDSSFDSDSEAARLGFDDCESNFDYDPTDYDGTDLYFCNF